MQTKEEKIKSTIKPYMKKARSGDWEHTLRVVKWVKILGKKRKDLNTLIVTAYIHDIGWSGIAPKGKLDLDEMLKLELLANKNSKKLVSEVLNKLKFSKKDINTVQRLVSAVDKHKAEKDDEGIILDADSLSKLCIEHLEQKYQPESFIKMINLWEKVLADRIKTKKGKEIYPELLLTLKNQISKKFTQIT